MKLSLTGYSFILFFCLGLLPGHRIEAGWGNDLWKRLSCGLVVKGHRSVDYPVDIMTRMFVQNSSVGKKVDLEVARQWENYFYRRAFLQHSPTAIKVTFRAQGSRHFTAMEAEAIVQRASQLATERVYEDWARVERDITPEWITYTLKIKPGFAATPDPDHGGYLDHRMVAHLHSLLLSIAD